MKFFCCSLAGKRACDTCPDAPSTGITSGLGIQSIPIYDPPIILNHPTEGTAMKDKTLDRRRYRWQLIEKDRERWLLDIACHEAVVYIVARETEEGTDTRVWWTVFAPFKKKAISQHLTEQNAVKFVEQHLGVEEKEQRKKEERISWED